MQQLIQIISLASILVIFFALFRAFTLRKRIPGGIVKEAWKNFYYIIGLLAAGYLTMPLAPWLPETSRGLITSIISLAGAVFIVMVINLLYKIIKEIGL